MLLNRNPPEVVAVIVMFNSHEEVARCVQTVLAQNHPGIEVLVLDNGSQDGSAARIQERFGGESRVSVATVAENRGFSGGANAGLTLALERRPTFVWLLTDDIELHPDAASHLVHALQVDGRIGLAGLYILDRSRPDTLYYGGGIFTPAGAVHEHRGEVLDLQQDLGAVRDTGYVTGASMFWRAEALTQVGLMDEAYWLYWEDADLSYRAGLAGWRVVVVPNALGWHDVTPPEDPSMPLRTRYSTRNELRFLKKFQLAHTTRKAWRTLIKGLIARFLRGRRLRGAGAMGALDHLLGRTGSIRGRW